MKYQFDIWLTAEVPTIYREAEEAEAYMDNLCDEAIKGSLLEKEYPDCDYMLVSLGLFGERTYSLLYKFKIEVEDSGIGGDRIEVAEENIEGEIRKLVQGCWLYREEIFVKKVAKDEKISLPQILTAAYRLSDEQPGIEEIISWIDEDQPIAIVSDANYWHIRCAETKYGEENVDLAIEMSEKYSEYRIIENKKLFEKYPKDSDGNLLHVVLGREYIQEINNGLAHGEDNLSSCGACRGYIHDDPREEEHV